MSAAAAPPGSVPRDPAGDVIAPPPPPVSGAELAAPPQPEPTAHQDFGVKVEKIDIADDDEDVSLEATLGQVSTFEASQYDGSDHSASSHDMGGLLSGLSDRGTWYHLRACLTKPTHLIECMIYFVGNGQQVKC